MYLGFPLGVASKVVGATVHSPADGLTFDQAFAKSTSVLRNWFQLNTGPRVNIDSTPIVGDVTITSQANATALVGKRVVGRVLINAVNIELADFVVEWDGVGTGNNLLQTINGANTANIHHFKLDGKGGNISYGLVGTTFSNGLTVTNGEIVGMGGDGLRPHKNSTYRHLYIHGFRNWNTSQDGAYNGNGDQNLYPHTDGVQILRSNNIIEECWIENTKAENSTSGIIIKPDADEQINGCIIRKCYVDGGGVPFYIDNANSNIDAPGTNLQPINITIQDIRVGRQHRESRVFRHDEVPSSSFTKSNVVYSDTRSAVPAVFVDDFNRANENLEANTNWTRASGAAGALTVDTNQVRSTTTTQSTFLLSNTQVGSLTNHFIQADWKGGSATGWLILRYADENNYVGMQVLALKPTLYTKILGTFTVRAACPDNHNAGDQIKIEAFGSVIRIYHKGILGGTYDMGAGVLTSGQVGIQARSTTANPMCDNVVAGTTEA